MNASSPMKPLIKFGRKPHPIDRRKYGQPRVALFYANRDHFAEPGLVLWTGARNIRVLPLPRRAAR